MIRVRYTRYRITDGSKDSKDVNVPSGGKKRNESG